MQRTVFIASFMISAAAFFLNPVAAQMGSFAGAQAPTPETAGLSQEMQQAIRAYQKGDDLSAMDGFMDILTSGVPSERTMANEYLNLLTRRMDLKARQGAVGEPQNAVVPEAPGQASAPEAGPAPSLPASPVPGSEGMNKALMEREIKVKIESMAQKSLDKLRAVKGVKIVVGPDGNPQAVGLPTSVLFGSGINFKKGADAIVGPLTDLIFALGNAQVQILPQGAPLGDAKIIDMRRAMGVSSALFSAGLAPDRVNVNLLNSQVNVPGEIESFDGVILVFVYDQPLQLNSGAVGAENGPPLSLGVDPPNFRTDEGGGSIIEFSVEEPPAGIASWEFQLLKVDANGSEGLTPIERVMGDSPVFHQIYWNGHERYFGAALPPGRYECVLIATDGKNRRRVLHRWITIVPPPTAAMPAPHPAAAPISSTGSNGAPSPDWASGTPKAASLVVNRPSLHWVQISRKRKLKRGTKRKHSHAPKISIRKIALVPTRYDVVFSQGSYQLEPKYETLVGKIADAAAAQPSASLSITGYAASSEANAAQLARSRGQIVANLLINRFGMDPSRLQVSSNVSEGAKSRAIVEFSKSK